MAAETVLARQAQAVADRQIIPALLTKTLIRKHYLPAGERTLDRWVSAGQFPRPDIAMGGKVRYWNRETVKAWIDQHAKGGGAGYISTGATWPTMFTTRSRALTHL